MPNLMSDRRRRARIVPRASPTFLSPGDLAYQPEIWVDRPAARPKRIRAECAASTDPLAYVSGPLVYDGHLDAFPPSGLFRRLGGVEAALVAYEAAIERTENAVQRAFLRRQRDQLSGRAACAALPD